MIVGIDFGAKNSGTTVIARMYESNKVDFVISEKKKDADQFIIDFMKRNEDIWLAYIDAPLSLPKIYCNGSKEGNYFYREADIATNAMSPMFLGGLTARAMKIAAELSKMGIKVVETYPSKLAEVLNFNDDYKKTKGNIPILCDKLKKISGFIFDNEKLTSWHHFDALLSLYSAKRHELQASMIFGDSEEGTITV